MPTIIACPNCHQDVSLPSRVEGALVCPHCDGEFSFSVATPTPSPDGSADQQPPFAPASVDVSPDAETEASEQAPVAQSVSQFPASQVDTTSYREAGFSHRDPRDEPGLTQPLPEEFEEPESGAMEQSVGEFRITDDETESSAKRGPVLAIETDPHGESSGRSAVVNRARRKKNPFGQLLGVIGGGALGLAIGYYLLNYFGGAQFNFLNLKLPGIKAPQPPAKDESQLRNAENSSNPSVGQRNEDAEVALVSGRDGERTNGRSGRAEPFVKQFTPPVFRAADLQRTLATASRALGCPDCDSTGFVTQRIFGANNSGERVQAACPTCAGKPYSKVNPQGYQALCELAQTVTWVDSSDVTARGSAEALRTLLLQTAQTAEQQSLLNELAGERLQRAEASSSSMHFENGDGVVLVGQIIEHRQSGPYFLTVLKLASSASSPSAEGDRQVVVAARQRAVGLLGESLLVAGAVLKNPQQTLPDFQGQEPLVVWGGFPLVVR
ncbi:MAG: Trm112 family protein [Pirellulales bacterium]|nr:Trm112 family protein [Pirellulales bacterium]